MFPSADKRHGDAGFMLTQDLAPAHAARINTNNLEQGSATFTLQGAVLH